MDFQLSIDFAKKLSMMARTEKGEEARNYFIECEKKLKANLPTTYIEALQALIVREQEKELAITQRDEAVRTKSYISDKKTATAMNTASQKSKEVKKLKIELDKSKDYASIKRMQLQYHGIKFNWRLLKDTARQMQDEFDFELMDKVFDANYGKVNTYHKEVWLETYQLEIN